MDGGGVGYTGIFQAKRNNRANGEPGVVIPPFQPEPPPPVVKASEVSMSTSTAGPRMLFTEASSVELLFLIVPHRKHWLVFLCNGLICCCLGGGGDMINRMG